MDQKKLLDRISFDPKIYNGKPIVRGRQLTVEKVLGQLAFDHKGNTLFEEYPWLEKEDIQACLIYATMVVGREDIEINKSDQEF